MPVSVTLVQKNSTISIGVGQPMGLLLALTYAEAVNTGLSVTLISKN